MNLNTKFEGFKRVLVRQYALLRTTGWMILSVALTGGLSACGSDVTDTSSNTNTTTLQGRLTDAVTGEAIVGALIEIGARRSTTDDNGSYEISNFPSGGGISVPRDYLATVTLTGVTSPIDMTNPTVVPRYPDRKFVAPYSESSAVSSNNHNFRIGKLSANIQGVVGDSNRLPFPGVTVELQDSTEGMAGSIIQSTLSDQITGSFTFNNIEAGVDYKLVGKSNDFLSQGEVETGKLADNQTLLLPLSGSTALVLSNVDSYGPRIVAVTPENNSDIAPGAVDVVLTFNEPIRQDSYSIPDPLAVSGNIYQDIQVSYGGQKAASNLAHDLVWSPTFDELTIRIPYVGVSSKYTVDLSLLSPVTDGTVTTPGKLKDNAGNGLENSPVLSEGNFLSFTTSGSSVTEAPIILSPNASGIDSGATSVSLDWLPVTGATKGYNIYRSTRKYIATGYDEPFIFLAGPISVSSFTDTFDDSGFTLLATPELAQYYVYRVTSVNADLVESDPSNELTIKDVVGPTAVGTAGTCVPPGGNSMTIDNPVTSTINGQVKFTFSEPLDEVAAENIANYQGINIDSAMLVSPTEVVLDFSMPITCVNTDTVTIGSGLSDVTGNKISGNAAQRTLSYTP